jgi:hypothetical protein
MRAEDQIRLSKKRRLRLVLLGLAFCVLVVGLVGYRICFPSHPQFGAIYQVQAAELNNLDAKTPLARYLRAHLPKRVLESPVFPARYRDEAKYVDLGGAQLYWSAGPNGGWLYFWGRAHGGGLEMDKWEFAPCTETNLMQVAKIPSTFFGSSDPLREEVFGKTSSTNAFNVAVGQIVFARWTQDTNRVFIFKVKAKNGAKVLIDYCVKK